MKLIEKREIAPDVFHLVFSTDKTFVPGQFVSLLREIEGKKERRPYSIANYEQGKIELCVKRIKEGKISPWVCELDVGEEVEFLGPMGVFGLKEGKEKIFIAVGTGIAPFRSMIPAALNDGASVTLLLGDKKKEDVLYEEEWKVLEENPHFSYHISLSREEKEGYEHGRVTALVKKYVPEGFSGDVYLCGLWDMICDVRKLLEEKGIEKKQIHFERYD